MARRNKQESSNQHSDCTNFSCYDAHHQQKRNKAAMIVGDSMVKNYQRWRLEAALKQNVKFHSFSGARIADIKPAIEEKADLCIPHFRTQDLRTHQNSEAIAERFLVLQ